MKKVLLVGAVTAVIIGAGGFYAVSQAHATGRTNWHQTLVQRLAHVFGKKETDVQAVFTQVRGEQRTEMQAKFTAKLDELVKAGTITAEQKQLIIDKQAELQKQRETNREEMMKKSPEERQAAMKAERAALEAWAKEKGIDLKVVGMGFGGSFGERGSMKGGKFHKQDTTPAASVSPTVTPTK